MKTIMNKKQSIVIAAIVIVTVLLGALILGTRPSSPDKGDEEDSTRAARATSQQADTSASKNDKESTKEANPKPTAEDNKINLTDAQVKAAGITLESAKGARIKNIIILPGEIHFNEDRTAHVVPRFAGVVQTVFANIGQPVRKGQVLAVIASSGLSDLRSEFLATQKRLSLATTTYEREKKLWQEKISAEQDYLQAQQAMQEAQIAVQNVRQKLDALGAASSVSGALNRYEIRAPFDGLLIEKRIALGDAVKEDTSIFTISDLSTVWAEMTVPASNLNAVRVGEKVIVKTTAFEAKANGVVSYVSALVGDQTRTAKARVTLPNPSMVWRPGLFVNIEVATDETDVPIAVLADAIQDVNGKPTVFLRTPEGFIGQAVVTGRSSGGLTEITGGLKTGTAYAAQASFVLKAELGKSTAKDND